MYRFTIQPVTTTTTTTTTSVKRRQFRCHVRHAPPTVLYRLFYYVQVPPSSSSSSSSSSTAAAAGAGAGRRRPPFQTTKLHRTVSSRRRGQLAYHQRGRHDVDFLTAEHDTGLRLSDDFVLTAVRDDDDLVDDDDDDGDDGRWNYSVRESTVRTPPAAAASSSGSSSSVHAVSDHVFVSAVQPQRPFAYRSQHTTTPLNPLCMPRPSDPLYLS